MDEEKKELDDMLTTYYKYEFDEEEAKMKKLKEERKKILEEPVKELEEEEYDLPLKDEDGNYLLSGILMLCSKFYYYKHQEYADKIQDVKNDLQIRKYLPLEDKANLIMPIIDQAKIVDQSEVMMTMNIEIGKIIIGLLEGYCINLVNDLNITSLQLDFIDLLYQADIIDYVLSFCEKDYNRLCHLIDECLNFTHIVSLLGAFNVLDEKNINNFNSIIKDLDTKMTPDRVALLKQMITVGTPEFVEMVQQMNEKILNAAKRNEKQEILEKKEENIEK